MLLIPAILLIVTMEVITRYIGQFKSYAKSYTENNKKNIFYTFP
jgi:uncharacterized protein (UPF0333 family)